MARAVGLLQRLIGIACDELAGKSPVLVQTATTTSDAGGWHVPFSWPTQEVADPAVLPGTVNRLLAQTPVVLIPPWSEPRGPHTPSPLADAMLGCIPTTPESLLIALLPASVLYSMGDRELRAGLADHWSLALLLSGNRQPPTFHHQFDVAAVALSDAHETLPIRFFRLPAQPDPNHVETDFRQLWKQGGGRVRHGYILRKQLMPGESLAFAQHDPDLLSRKDDLARYGGTVPLGELFDISPGRFFPPRDNATRDSERGSGTTRVISGRDVLRTGLIAPADDDSRWAHVSPELALRAGDIVLRALQSPSDPGGLVAAEVADADLPLTATHTVFVLRAKAPIDEQHWLLIVQFLRTPLAKSLVSAPLGPGVRVARQALMELPIPQPDEAMRAAIKDLLDARTRFAAWHAEADTLLNSVFTGASAEISRARLVRTGRTVRLRCDAATELDDINHTFRTRFPYPIAHHWRRMEAARSAGVHREAYAAVLDVAEILCAYVSFLGLALAREADIELGAFRKIRSDLNHHGPTFGTWTSTLQEIRGTRLQRHIPTTTPLHDLGSLLADKETDNALQALVDRRNNESHQRHVTAAELPQALPSALDELRTVMTSAIFLTDLRLVHITSTAWNRLHHTNTIHYQEYMGDHNVLPTRLMEYHTAEVEKDSLYILDGQQQLHPLRPYLIGRNCPECHAWSTFHADRITDGVAVFKSMEHGHTFKQSRHMDSLEHTSLM